MATERRQKVLLGLLVIVLLAVAIYRLWPATSTVPPASSNRQAVATRGTGRAEQAAAAQGTPGAPDVHLDALDAEKPKPNGTDRNLFPDKPKAPAPGPPAPAKGGRPGCAPPGSPGPAAAAAAAADSAEIHRDHGARKQQDRGAQRQQGPADSGQGR